MRAQHRRPGLAVLDVERVVHAARRVVGWQVECLEVVPVGLDVGTLGDLEPEPDEHVFEPFPRLRHDMSVAAPWSRHHLGEVDPFRSELSDALGRCKVSTPLSQAFGHRDSCLVDCLTGRPLLLDRGQRAETGLERGERTALAEQLGFEGAHFVGCRRLPDTGQRGFTRPLHFFDHLHCLLTTSHGIGRTEPPSDEAARRQRVSAQPRATPGGTEIADRPSRHPR